MTAPLVFVIPVRHPGSVSRWDVVVNNLAMTLASIAAQTVPAWECVVVANRGALLPPLPARCRVEFVDLPLPRLPDRTTQTEAFYDAVRHDKGLRLYAGLRTINETSHVMVVDFDDFVSRRLAETVSAHRDCVGWTLTSGYVWAGGSWCHARSDFHRLCGTSHIIRRDALGKLDREDGTPDVDAIKRRLGSHIFIDGDLASAGTPLDILPYRGAVYRIGNPDSTSGTGALFAATTPVRDLLRHPRRSMKGLSGYRRVTPAMRAEFSLPQVSANSGIAVLPQTKAHTGSKSSSVSSTRES